MQRKQTGPPKRHAYLIGFPLVEIEKDTLTLTVGQWGAKRNLLTPVYGSFCNPLAPDPSQGGR